MLSELTNYLGISYDERMIGGWSKATSANFDRGQGKKGPADFIAKAVNSTGIEKPQEQPISLSKFPASFQPYITDMLSQPMFEH